MGKTQLFVRKQKGGVFTVVNEAVTTGNIYWVDSGKTTTGGDTTGHGSNPDAPFLTIDYAIGRCTANNGDIIYVMPGHAETVAATVGIACDVAGVSIIGLGVGRSRPAITAHASAIDAISVSVANVHLENLRIIGAASCTALINLAGADFTARDLVLEHGAAPVMAVTVASGGNRFSFRDCVFSATADGPDCGIDIEAGVTGPWEVIGCDFNYAPYGLDIAGIRSDTKSTEGGVIKYNTFVGMEVAAIDFNSSSTDGGDGLIAWNTVGAKGAVADIDTLIDAGGYCLCQNYGTDTASEGGGLIPVTTPV